MRAKTFLRGATCFAALTIVSVLAELETTTMQPGPTVSTTHGDVMGGMGYSRNSRMYYEFKGIPYGKVVDRFGPPTIPDKWEEMIYATDNGNRCIQYNPFAKEIIGEEDCLNLNVFTTTMPMEGRDKILHPVIVYLHPGLNNIGSNADFDAQYFMDEDVVLVVPNYRLGLFGFLNTGDMYAQGNAGLKDQVLALKWVQENIEAFGGDSSRVTIMGSGSGGADAFLHTLSPKSKGLVHNVIAMGGSTISRSTVILDPFKQAKKLAMQVGCPYESSAALVMCLRGKDAKDILEKVTKLNPKEFNQEEVAWFGPSIEKPLEGQTEDDLVLPDNPAKLLKEGKIVNKVPLILGGNEHQGITLFTEDFLLEKKLLEKMDKQWDELAPELLFYKDAKDPDVISAKLRKAYFGNKTISEETFPKLAAVFMDRLFGYGLVIQSTLYSKAAPVYLYLFVHKPEHTKLEYLGVEKNFGMAHLDELQFLFKLHLKSFGFPEITEDSSEYNLSTGLVKLLGSFAETGKPSKTWGDGKEWKKIDAGEPGKSKWYLFGNNTAFTQLPSKFTDRIGIWDDLYSKELSLELVTPEEKF